jgi:hypothetical protein
MSDELVAWLREQITADLEAARIVGAGGFEPQRWDTDPPGQVNPAPAPYGDQINAVLVPDPEDRRDRESLPGWVEVVSYDRMLGKPPEADCRDDDLPVALIGDGRREVDHICRHDPRNVVARCEAELAILDECDLLLKVGIAFPDEAGVESAERIMRLIGAAYRHRDGYLEEWKPT